MEKPKDCAPALWKKASKEDRELFAFIHERFLVEFKILSEYKNVTDAVIAHNLAWVATWIKSKGVNMACKAGKKHEKMEKNEKNEKMQKAVKKGKK